MSVDVNSADWEDAICEKAQTQFKDAWDLALETEDEELFEKVWNEATRLVVDDVITSLIDKGFVEPAGMDNTGDMLFGLTPAGLNYGERRNSNDNS